MKYKAVIFDIDGTLLDSEERSLRALQWGVEQATGRRYSFEELRFSLGIPGNVIMDILGIQEAEKTRRLWHEEFLRLKHLEKVYDGIPEVLEALKKRGILLGIVTSRPRAQYAEGLGSYPIAVYFTESVCGDDTENPKPAPDPLLFIMEKFHVKPEETLYVGDTRYDMECAGSAGADGALALWGAFEPDKISCTWKISRPEEILGLL